MKNQSSKKAAQPLSKKQQKKAGRNAPPAKKKPFARLRAVPKEKKLFVVLVAVISLLAIACATFGGIIIANAVSTPHPYASVYETISVKDYLKTNEMKKDFYTGKTFDFSGIEARYADKDLAYMDEYLQDLLLQNRILKNAGQKQTPIGFADDLAMYITAIYRGNTPSEETRIPIRDMTLGSYVSATTFTVGTEHFGKSFDDALIAGGFKPVDTGREVRYNGKASVTDLVCISFEFYSGTVKKVEAGAQPAENLIDRYTWSQTPVYKDADKKVTYGLSSARASLQTDIESVLATALATNCQALGETYSFVLENYSLSGDQSNVGTYKVEAQIHFVIESEVTKDISFTIPADFFNQQDGTTLVALNGKDVTFRVIFGATDDYDLPTLDAKFIKETLAFETDKTEDSEVIAEYKQKKLEEINADLAETRYNNKISQIYLNLAETAQSKGYLKKVDYTGTALLSNAQSAVYQELRNQFIRLYQVEPTADALNSFAVSYAASQGVSVQGYSDYISVAAESRIPQEMIMFYIFDKSGLDRELTDEKLQEAVDAYVAELVASSGDPETYNASYFIGKLGETNLYKQVRRELVYDMVGAYLYENNYAKLS